MLHDRFCDRERPAARPHRLRSWLLQIAVAVIVVGLGGGIAAFLILTKPKPEGKPPVAPPRLVRVMEAARAPHRCSASAFGTVNASQEWTAIASTHGDAVRVDPKFEPGELILKDTLLVEIDTEDYRLAQRRYEAEMQAREAQLKELQETEKNLEEIRELQKEQLDLAKKDLERIQRLLKNDAMSEAAADTARTTHLTRLLALQETTNSLTLIPMLRARAEAEWGCGEDSGGSGQAGDREVFDPHALRRPVRVEVDRTGSIRECGAETWGVLSLNTAEVVAMVESGKGHSLFPRGVPGLGSIDMSRSLEDLEPLRRALNTLDAEIQWGTPPRRGKVIRIGSTLDPATRTFPVIIEVAAPYADVQPGVRPPLVPDVFCEVTLYGATIDNVVVVPRDCLHEMPRKSLSDEFIPVVYLLRNGKREQRDGATYFENGSLDIQEVKILVEEEDVVVLDSGVEEGDLVVLGDLYVPREHWGAREFGPASEAMPLSGLLETPANLHRTGPETPGKTPPESESGEAAP